MTDRNNNAAIEQIRALCTTAIAGGKSVIRFRKATGNSPKNWDHVRLASGTPALFGRCIGPAMWPGQWAFEVRVSDAERWLKGLEK